VIAVMSTQEFSRLEVLLGVLSGGCVSQTQPSASGHQPTV
jgi:hypothetical protein